MKLLMKKTTNDSRTTPSESTNLEVDHSEVAIPEFAAIDFHSYNSGGLGK